MKVKQVNIAQMIICQKINVVFFHPNCLLLLHPKSKREVTPTPLPRIKGIWIFTVIRGQKRICNTAKGKCKLGKVRLYDGYDDGGAYWGIGETLYCAKSKTSAWERQLNMPDKPGFSFVRANSPYEALKEFESMGLVF